MQVDIDFIFNMFEKACKTKGYGYGIGARKIFDVSSINKLVTMSTTNKFMLVDTTESQLAFLVDDIGLLCKEIIKKRFVL